MNVYHIILVTPIYDEPRDSTHNTHLGHDMTRVYCRDTSVLLGTSICSRLFVAYVLSNRRVWDITKNVTVRKCIYVRSKVSFLC